MNLPPPAIIVTVPARSVGDARSQVAEAHRAGANLAEIRLDRFSVPELDRLGTLFPSPLPLIATLRSRAEGGEGPDDAETRIQRLREFARHPFRWIDAEAARDFPAAESLTRTGVQDLIVSTHLPASVPGAEWSRLLRQSVPAGGVRKVVSPSSVGRLLNELLPAIPPPGECALVALTTGPSGPLLRAWSRKLGFPFVFASLPESTDVPSTPAVERSQIPVDRLLPFLRSEGTPPLFAIAGHPVDHSRSPTLFARWMREDGNVGLYVALDFEIDAEFADSMPKLAAGGFRGLSVTHPLKAVASELADEVGPGATACGVANTLTFGPDGVSAENTDLVAILRRFAELRSAGAWDGASVGVIGAGGAARATLAAARSLGVEAYVWARRAAEAERLAREFGARSVASPRDARPTLVVHATTAGRRAESPSSPPNLDWIQKGVHAVDWVYLPEDPLVRRAAERVGTTYEDGSRLLVYQAAAAYGIWWDHEPSAERVAAAVGDFR